MYTNQISILVARNKKLNYIITMIFTLIFISKSLYADDNISNQSSTWIACASANGTCNFTDKSNIITMRYGAQSEYFYIVSNGLSSLPCKNWLGDPNYSINKNCSYTTSNILSAPDNSSWTQCASENGTCKARESSTKLQWIRYGYDNKWLYSLHSMNEPFPCNNSFFQLDPYSDKNKVCQYGEVFKASEDPDFITCANENENCKIDTEKTVILRYGANNSNGEGWTYRLAKEDSIKCSNTIFGHDPLKGSNKLCQYASIEYPNIATEGKWTKIVSCSGKGCVISKSITNGTTHTDTSITSQEWGESVTISMESGFEIEGVGEKVSTSISTSYSRSQSFQESLSNSISNTIQATCNGDDKADFRVLYQFMTTTTADCLNNGICSGETFTADYACVSNPPSGYNGPQCVPGYCADNDKNLCLTCSY